MPTRRRAGAAVAEGRPAARTVLRTAGIGIPLVPVPDGYRTSRPTPSWTCWGGAVLRVTRVVPWRRLLQPRVSRRRATEPECETGSRRPQRLAAVASVTWAPAGRPPAPDLR